LPEEFTPKDAKVAVLALIVPRVGNAVQMKSWVYGSTGCLTRSDWKQIGSGVYAVYIRVMEQGVEAGV
jgi:hypothetical protein